MEWGHIHNLGDGWYGIYSSTEYTFNNFLTNTLIIPGSSLCIVLGRSMHRQWVLRSLLYHPLSPHGTTGSTTSSSNYFLRWQISNIRTWSQEQTRIWESWLTIIKSDRGLSKPQRQRYTWTRLKWRWCFSEIILLTVQPSIPSSFSRILSPHRTARVYVPGSHSSLVPK